MIKFLKNIAPDAIAVVAFLIISFFYFATPLSEGLVLGGHDSVASIGCGQEGLEHLAETGERSRWTGAVFSGMPTYQIAPAYDSGKLLNALYGVYGLGTSGVLNYVFLYLLGFYILLRVLSLRPWVAAVGAIAWAFSSYFFIIIAAGHIWKVMTLALIPPTIAGMILCYRGKLLWGGAITALFTALQIMSNHVQMSYYFLFLMTLLTICYGVAALLGKKNADATPLTINSSTLTVKKWLKATTVIAFAGILGVLANLPNLYHTYTYSKESMRGKSELTPPPSSGQKATEGLDRDYITQWSYGIDETLTLLIPEYKGGGSRSILDRKDVEKLDGYNEFRNSAYQFQQMTGGQAYPPGIMEYWGDQPFTVGPVYVGAVICFLFVLSIFYVGGPVKWALVWATMLSFLFAWGKNLMPVTDFFIDYLPMYNKFRTVSSALVVAEFTFPLLAILALAKVLRTPETLFGTKAGRIGMGFATAFTTVLCLLLAFIPSIAGDCLSQSDAYTLNSMNSWGFDPHFTSSLKASIVSMHHDILSSSALNSGLLCLAVSIMLWLWTKKRIPAWALVGFVGIVTLVDMWIVNKKYLNDDSFSNPISQMQGFAKTPADEQILADTALSYRVANLGGDSPFNETTNETSYYHKSIGGYHAAKLHRYQDLIDHHLNRELEDFTKAIGGAGGDITSINMDSIAPVLNMLNTKYFIFGRNNQAFAVENIYHNGNGWFVDSLQFVPTADAEIAGLHGMDTKHEAVADESFRNTLETSSLGQGTVELTHYAPNELHYKVQSEKGGIVVFSEIYYPGWTATIDGKEAEIGRANYVLRALRVPAGQHEIRMEFRPASVDATDYIAFFAIGCIKGLLLGAIIAAIKRRRQKKVA
ncbi:MAG: YfhO family protein [Bacteroidaceae bacterium]|nr:YfhO family protein [Bacteroidaceae bacterium]